MKNRPLAQLSQRAKIAVALVEDIFADQDGPGVTYLISFQGDVLASGARGLASVEWGIANTDETVMRLGSISKSITAIAVLQLVEQGKLDLDVPIVAYAPDLPGHMGDVTMRQLLSHRSGLAEHAFDESLLEFIWQPMTTDKVIALQVDKDKDFEPGAAYNYVNFNYVVVAHVVEKVTGKTFIDFVNDAVFAANGMMQSHYDELHKIILKRAEFYDQRLGDGVLRNTAEVDMSHVSAAGALLSSAKDMAHWAQLLVDGKLVSKAVLEEAWHPAPLPDGTPTSYGLGFNLEEMAGERLVWHTGMTPGAQSAFEIAPESEIFIILLSNGFHLPSTGKLIDRMMMVMLTGEDPEEKTEG